MSRQKPQASRSRLTAGFRNARVFGDFPPDYPIRAYALARFVSIASDAIGLAGEVSVLIAGSRRMRGLNRRFRGKNHATDVLSFPAPVELSPTVAGDLAISVDAARRQADHLRHSLEAEMKVLALHGLLHLAGWDHESDDGEMADQESRLRLHFKLPVALIERKQPISGGKQAGVRRASKPSRAPRISMPASRGPARRRRTIAGQ